MNKKLSSLIVFTVCVFTIVLAVEAKQQSNNVHQTVVNSNTDFYIVYTDNYDDGSGSALFITSKNSTYGNVSIPGIGFSQDFTVLANTITPIDIPLEAEVQGSDIIDNLGIRLVANDEITAYFLNPGEPVATNDAYVALPVEMLGLEYIVMAWPDTLPARGYYDVGFSELAIVSPYNDNTITIVPNITTSGHLAGEPYSINLDQYQTYTLQSDDDFEDLTGTIIQSTLPIAVFSGTRCADIPAGYGWCDHVIEQMPPTNAWGSSFSTRSMMSRLYGDYLRILASEDETTITLNGTMVELSEQKPFSPTPAINCDPAFCTGIDILGTMHQKDATYSTENSIVLNRGEFFETLFTGSIVIDASQPVLVAQFATGQGFDGTLGDPLMMLVVPEEQFLNNYTILTPTGYPVNYVNVIVPDEATSTVVLDGSPVDSGLFTPIGVSGLSEAAISVGEGSHTITAGDQFGLYVYGFGDYVSYGYPGGMNSQVINPPPPDPEHLPVIIIPGLGGTRIVNDQGEIWLDLQQMVDDSVEHLGKPTSDFLDVTRLNISGTGPLFPNDPHYSSVHTGGVIASIHETVTIDLPFIDPITRDIDLDFYQGLIDYFESNGYQLDVDLFLFEYDWRRDLSETASSLDNLIDSHRGDGKVNIVAHSMGGLVTRNYILNSEQATKVDHVAILGTPFLGVPYAFKGLYFGDDFGINDGVHDRGLPGFINLINEEKIKEIAENWPGIYQLLPGQRYFSLYEGGYIQEDIDINGDGQVQGALDYPQTQNFTEDLLNETLVNLGSQFHSAQFDGFDQGSNGVDVCLFAGIGFPTEERIRFWQEQKWWGWQTIDHVSWWWGNGDETVVQHSIDLKDGDTNYQGSAHVFYANASHVSLPTNSHIQQQIWRCFADNYVPINENISTNPNSWPLQGYWTEVNSPVELHIYDELGNHVGPTVTGAIEYGIPGAQYIVAGHDKTAFVPKGINYEVVLIGVDEGDFDLRVRDVMSGTISTTVLYKDVPVIISSTANLPIAGDWGIPVELDIDGDGNIDSLVDPTAVLDGEGSIDDTPPTTIIELEGPTDENGWFTGMVTVTMSAMDNSEGTGVTRIEYSLDQGVTVNVYSEPFVVDSSIVEIIYAKALDLAGNEEFPLAEARIQPLQVYIPTVVR